MTALLVLALLVAVAVLAPRLGADSRWDGAGLRPDRARTRRRATATGSVHDALSETGGRLT